MSKSCFITVFLTIIFLRESSTTIPRYFRGRPRGGMLGAPYVDHDQVKVPEAQWFEQRLTHFNDADKLTWMQRYWYNDTLAKPGGPVFIMIGGEGEASPVWLLIGSMMKYAEELGAFVFLLEHRFYGESHPLG